MMINAFEPVAREKKLALLIDAENISSKYIELIINEAKASGNIIYKRIYGNWTSPNMKSWRDVILDYSIHPVQQYNNTTNKNASDSCLIIEAMDLLYTGKLDGFCLVTSDSDFTRLAARLIESEMFVLGMGESKTPRSFKSACSKFITLDLLLKTTKKARKIEEIPVGAMEESRKTSKVENPALDKEIIKTAISQIIEEQSDDEGRVRSAALGNYLIKQFPDFDVRNFGFSKLKPFVASLGMFEEVNDPQDNKVIYYKVKQ